MGRKKGFKQSEETKQKIAIAKKGVHVSPKTEFKKGQSAWNKGKKLPKQSGSNHPNWSGGSSRYWGKKILRESGKDTKHCQICKEKKRTEIHHIDGNSNNNKLNNLGVVCSYCHFAIHDNGKNTRFGGLN